MKIGMHGLLAVGLAIAVVASAGATEIRKAGECKLKARSDLGDAHAALSVTVGNDKIEAVCRFSGGDFFGGFALFAVPAITNKSGKPTGVSYNVAFFDKTGELIAASSQGFDLAANAKDVQFSSCLTKIPKDSFERVASYKLVIYLADVKKK
jgi:hypothetical protein